jgi:hypothetical protein
MLTSLRETITYWAPSGETQFGGKSFAAPVTVKCHWEDHNEYYNDEAGREFLSKARIFCDRPVSALGYLYRGTSTAVDPTTLSGAEEIRVTSSIPDIASLRKLHTAYV